MKIVKRVVEKGIGYFWQDALRFDNVMVLWCGYHIVSFEYKDKEHKIRLYEGKYGSNFRFHNTTYYVADVSKDGRIRIL